MSKVKIEGHGTGTGTFTVTTPSSNTDRTITLPDSTGTLATTAGGVAQLDHSGTKKLEATSTGATLTGDLAINDAHPEITFTDSDDTSYSVAYHSAGGFLIDVDKGQDVANSYFRLSIDDTPRLRVTADGLLFNSDTAAANALDDYEEGTWTPVVKDDANNTSPSITHNYSTYTKIGRMVTLTTELSSISSSGLNSVGDVRVYGLPFTVTTFGIGAVNMENVDYKDTFTDTESVTTIAMDTFVYFRVNRNNGGSQGLEGGDLNSGSSGFSFTVTYFV